jgi:hypothetical protein
MDAPAMDTYLDALVRAGATWVRFDLMWANVQQDGPDEWDWSAYDRVVAAAWAHGIRSLPILDYTPRWARRPGCSELKCAPADPAAFARFAAAAVSRYSAVGVDTWEIWNEPNLGSSWRPAADAGAYGTLLRATTNAIRETGRPATVLLGGLGPAVTEDGDVTPTDFVRTVYETAGGMTFDGIAMHPYSFPALPTDPLQWTGWSQMGNVRALMVARGDEEKLVWITEFGAPTNGPGATATFDTRRYSDGADHVDEALQERMAVVAVSQAVATPWAYGFFWYNYQDLGSDRSDNEDFFGIVRRDGSLKPSFYSLRQAFLDLD